MSVKEKIKDIRTNYTKDALEESDVPKTPFPLFEEWLADAIKNAKEPNAMIVSSNGIDGFPSSRVVLLRGFSKDGFIFYTNYNSQKGKEFAKDAKVSCLFFWPELERQVRIQGVISKTSEKVSDEYFASRPRESQLGAWASNQSQTLEEREVLEKKLETLRLQYDGKDVPRPPHWGGYIINPNKIEFWQGRASRLHDRMVMTETELGVWDLKRLYP
ncbi:pyridoxamine 5'-phosphate oxidase [Luteibaculum oceani]|uniref:Pyridoxine/pyridoxamine 5'-phosphate oxidase n=1 Tax=Luteibaculum oceani TaxID=1294296 RepID=A0A5C6UVF5_9FLAO|nr:pyridoxamine 5'-phosphate oxidase [Luteibaculum oceani]TXC76106.1 pyridoxamine 5'-phosphate oxidase [Luteibaculum oceani]